MSSANDERLVGWDPISLPLASSAFLLQAAHHCEARVRTVLCQTELADQISLEIPFPKNLLLAVCLFLGMTLL